ncbi:MAG: hypothetical protein ACYSUQ_01200 [Planctomycetota bacterium]|jgi:hypothetical protein
MRLRAFAILAATCLVCNAPTHARDRARRIYTYREADKARRLARRECRPLVIHFVPDSRVGAGQLESFYKDPKGVSREVLDNVVIVVVPTARYRRFARRLGITGPGGYRTISAYDLSPVDENSVPTCRSGFI